MTEETTKKQKSPRASKQNELMRSRGFLTVAEVAKRTGYKLGTIYKWLDDGRVEGENIASHRYVSITSLARHLGPQGAKLYGFPYPADPEPAPKG